jgi:hypothetical protein
MTAPTTAAPATRQGGAGSRPGNAQQKTVQPRNFVAGTRRVDKSTYDQTKTLTASTQDLPVYECDPNGFLGGMYILVECVTAGNAATVTFAANGPFIALDTVIFNDTNNKPILGPMTGHDLMLCVKYGGYSFIDDPRQSTQYSATAGAGATGGSFTFILPLPVQIARRDALGALTNKSASSTFDVTIRLSANASIYGTPPTTPGSVRTRIQQWGWMDPNATDMRGRPVAQTPPANGTTQFWSKQSYTVNSGSFNIRLQGLDSLIRNLLFVLVDNAGSRTQGDADFPDPFNMQYETSQPIARLRSIWRHMIGEMYGYTAAAEAAGGRDLGVYPESYAFDFSAKPGNESRLGYLPASSATNLALNGSIGGSGTHTLYVLVNKVVPANGDPMSLTGR